MARYVMRLSIALGDLRIAARYATRARQNRAERLYFVRLMASHVRELVLIMDPPNRQVVPPIDEFLRALPRDTSPTRSEIRQSHARALKMLEQTMAEGRPLIETRDGDERRPKLRDDLKEIRNRFLHYGHDRPGDRAVQAAMEALEGQRTGYVIREHTMRALYADDVGFTLTHPFPAEFAEDMHGRVVELLEPVSLFIHQVEAAWLHKHRDHVDVRLAGRERKTLREMLGG
ncbi:MAG: hypothetical protein QOJ82_3745 [Solirubrobacteraceae bacterium]|nr:hypothetical protein [Solirubrobacteraceae bacterium]